MNAIFLKDLADKVRRGLRGRVEFGKAGGRQFLWLRCREAVCHRRRAPFVAIGRSTGPTRRLSGVFFRDYSAGKSPKKIAFELHAERVAGPRPAAA